MSDPGEAPKVAAEATVAADAGTLSLVAEPISSRHIGALDGVRGLAVLAVMLHHMTLLAPATHAEQLVQSVMTAGWLGVDLFFVLSGALITGILLDTKKSTRYFTSFYGRRILRIFPLYFALLIFSFYVLPLFPHPKLANFSRIGGEEGWYWVFLQNYSIAHAGGFRHGIMDVTWTLAIEEQFYLVWPLVVALLSRRTLAIVSGALIALSLGLRLLMQYDDAGPVALYVLTPLRLEGLSAGALVALAIRSSIDVDRLKRAAVWLMGSGFAPLALFFLYRGSFPWDDPVLQGVGYTVMAVLFAGIVLGAIVYAGSGNLFDRIFTNRLLMTFGKYSYAMYLFHLPLRALLRDIVFPPVSFNSVIGGALVAQALFWLAGIGLTFVMAWLSFHLFEKHFLALKRFLPA